MYEVNVIRKIDNIIKDLRSDPKIQGWFVSTKEGIHIESDLNKEANRNFVAAISATLMNISKGAVEEFGCGEINKLFIQGIEGNIVLSEIVPNYIVGVLEESQES